MKVLRSTKLKTTNDKNGEYVPHLEINKMVLVHFNIVNNDYQQDSEVLYTLISNKQFVQSLDISTKYFISLFFIYWSMIY